ncbi:cyclase family protein [Methanolobus sp. ZRKC2]|uniref:cyclase family protein n=1 Tax=Methanolobus sp. ZRKC2 TaxID=3125783 RepID=UPI00324E9248
MSKFNIRKKIIDISVGISPDTFVYPGDPETQVESVSSIDMDGYAVSRVSFGTHTGTHVDAPSHIFEEGLSIEKIPIEALVGEAIVLDLSFVNSEISSDDLKMALGKLVGEHKSDVQVLLIKTCVSLDVKENEDSLYTQRNLDASAGLWIMEHGFRTVGVDTLSVDSDASFDNHRLFLENGIIIVENLNFSEVNAGFYQFVCLPLKLYGCDGAPARAILFENGL